MTDIKLFNIAGKVNEYQGNTVPLEKELQTLIEQNMESFFGVRFLASEFQTTDGGRMDSIGIDENNSPVIFEYKRSLNENVINQGLFYLNWLLDHKDSFNIMVMQKSKEFKIEVDWSFPRLVCVAGDFTKFDVSAIKQMNHNITLIRYKKFGSDLLMFEQLNETLNKANLGYHENANEKTANSDSFQSRLQKTGPDIKTIYEDLHNYILSLGDDISEKQLKFYVAFSKIRNFVCVEVFQNKMLLHLKLDVESFPFENGFSRDMSKIGHYATGDVEITIRNRADYEKAKPFLDRAYYQN